MAMEEPPQDQTARNKELESYKHELARDLETVKNHFARDIEQVKDHYARHIKSQDAHIGQATKSFDATIQYGLAVLRGAFILNGGAAIGTATLLSGTMQPGRGSPDLSMAILWPLVFFTIGALLPVVASGLTYLAQFNYTQALFSTAYQDGENPKPRIARGDLWQRLTIALMIVDGVCFFFGCLIGVLQIASAIRQPGLT